MRPNLPIELHLEDVDTGFDPDTTLGVVDFGLESSPGFNLPLPQLGPRKLREIWGSSRPVTVRGSDGRGLSWAGNDEVLFGTVRLEASSTIEPLATATYKHLVELSQSLGYGWFLRIWNHLSRINEIEGLERYQSFCRGRYEALATSGFRMGDDLPAASAVGSGGDGLWVYFIAGRHKPEHVENPRQMSAYQYPEKYGPRSPSFSRAAVLHWPEGSLVVLSGTASIVGHESVHEGDLPRQIEETIANMDLVMRNATGNRSGVETLDVAKVYLRHPDHAEEATRLLEQSLAPSTRLLVLQSDICRRELLIEIEGVSSVIP